MKTDNYFFSMVSLTSFLLAIGCADPTQPDYYKLGLVDVSGTVLLDGNPLDNATIEFVDPDSQSFSYGITDASGHYTLMFDSRKSGIIPGEKQIRIRSGVPSGLAEGATAVATEEEDPDRVVEATSVAVPSCYKELGKVKVTVSGSESNFDFDLSSDCNTTGRKN